MDERRKKRRTPLDRTVEVFDQQYGDKLGVLMDISPNGFRVKSDESLDTCNQIKLRMSLAESIFGKTTIEFEAVCVWSQKDPQSDGWNSGFEFCQVSQEATSTIIGLILDIEK